MDARQAAESVKQRARQLGFDLVGIAAARHLADAEARYLAWVEAGRHGEMGWIDQARARLSCRPDELLPDARSFVAVAAAYARGPEPPPPDQHGRVARYARGRDYHDVLKDRLRLLAAGLEQLGGPSVRCRLFVDTGPMLDREAAVRAGLGFYGKNTCLLTPGAGSYLLLGTILTTLALEPDSPLQRDCGQCRRCIDACPTEALVAPFQLDARRCIAYLTIELRGPIPSGLRPALGERLFGCDICQEVCPYNAGRGPLPWPELGPSPAVGRDVDLPALLALDDAGFRQRFKGSPLKRAKRRGLLRNAAVVLGNRGDRRAVPHLARALRHDPEPMVRAHAAWALRRLGGSLAQAALERARREERDRQVLAELDDATPELSS